MIEYMGKIIDDIPEDIKGEPATPTAHHFFEIAEDATKLSQAGANLLHHFVAQLLYLSKRSRPDIQLLVSFLCTRVRGPDTDDYKKIARVMKSSPGKVIFSMINCIGKMLDDFPEDMKGESATPAAHHLFYIAEDATKISQADADIFHHFVAQLIYISNISRPDIQVSVSLLFTRVRGPDTDVYKKLVRVMKYIQGTIGLTLIFPIDKSGNIKWYVDASFAVHTDMRSHTGGFMTMGTGGAYVQSSKKILTPRFQLRPSLSE